LLDTDAKLAKQVFDKQHSFTCSANGINAAEQEYRSVSVTGCTEHVNRNGLRKVYRKLEVTEKSKTR